MSAATKRWLTFFVAFILGTLYALLVSLISFKLRVALLSWPVWIILFAYLLWRFDLLRLAGYLAVLPFSIVTFEVAGTRVHPPKYVYQLLTLDRSHYIPRTHVSNPQAKLVDSDTNEPAVGELYIADDGFRADPATKKGNPARCRHALIGDSMVYGLGLSYADTLGPVLEKMNVEACVFGVAGNSPA